MGYDVRITRLPTFALFDLKGPEQALGDWYDGLLVFPAKPNSLTRSDGCELFHIGPQRWLLRAELAQEHALQDALRPELAPPEISIVPVSDTLCFHRISGPDAGEIMAIACSLDLHPSVFAEDAVSYTEAFGQKALVLRCADGFDLAVEQSFGDMLADVLARAMG